MSQFVTELDSPKAKSLAERWEACSEAAQRYAALYGGQFFPLLPHVIAEAYDGNTLERVAEYRRLGEIPL